MQFATEAGAAPADAGLRVRRDGGQPKLVPLLLGLGIRSFSMNAGSIPRVKQAVRALDIGDCARFARRVMEQSDPARIRELVAAFAGRGGGRGFDAPLGAAVRVPGASLPADGPLHRLVGAPAPPVRRRARGGPG
jgi:hypothetical protein